MNRYYARKNDDLVAVSPANEARPGKEPLSVRLSIWYKNRPLPDIGDFMLNIDKGEIFIYTDNPLKIGERIFIGFYIPYNDAYLGEFEGEVASYCVSNGNWPSGMHALLVNRSGEKMKRLKGFLQLKGLKIELVV